MTPSSDTLDTIFKRLERLHPAVIDLSCDRMLLLLERLGNPHLSLPRVVHIAGTNGKGSTLAFLRTILEQHGQHVHLYTSPHLVSFHERIYLAGSHITTALLQDVLLTCEAANKGEPITFFEITTCAAFLAFSRIPADILLLETGLGGRLDATNVIVDPVLCLLSSIDYDHMDYLGNTLPKIAYEKAMIQKSNCITITAPQHDDVLPVIKACGAKQNIKQSYHHGDDWWLTHADGSVCYQSPQLCPQGLSFESLGLAGRHQMDNAGLALSAAFALQQDGHVTLDDEKIIQALSSTTWPGRLEPVDPQAQDFFTTPFKSPWRVILDGAHNASAGQRLADYCEHIKHQGPIYMIFGMLNAKDITAFLKPLSSHITQAFCIPFDHMDACPPDTVTQKATAMNMTCQATSLQQAENILHDSAPGHIIICGSLYMIGSLLAKRSFTGGSL